MPKKRGTYDEKILQVALNEIRNKQISKKKASLKYNIPRSTLIFRLGEKFQKVAPGPSPILTTREENAIADWLIMCQKKGFPKRKEDVLDTVKLFIDADKRKTPFKNNMPGRGWFNRFLQRNPQIAIRIPDPVTTASSKVSASDIKRWFDSIGTYLKESNSLTILESSSRIFNGDETNFMLCPKTRSVLAAKGARNIYEIDRGAAKSNLTVMCTFGADGLTIPPMVIYPYKRVPEEIRKSVPSSWALGCSDNGWMTKEIFYEYISKHFHPFLVKSNVTFPVIYFVDGHSTHMTLKVSELCVRLDIIIIALYPNATRILQPCDYAAFKPLKNCWSKNVLKWRKENPGASLTREHFAPLLLKAFDGCITPEILQNGFKACGLYPFNYSSIDFTKCLGKSSENCDQITPQLIDRSITSKQFNEIVGQSKITTFENILKNSLNLGKYDENFNILFKLYTTLNNHICPQALDLTVPPETTQYQVDDGNDIIHEIDISEIDSFIYIDNDISNLVDETIGATVNISDAVEDTNAQYPESTATNIATYNQGNTQIKSIEDYLDWPETPVKTGNQTAKSTAKPKKPFVLTSPLFIQAERQRQMEKQKLEHEKEARKTAKIEKQRIKQQEIQLKALKKQHNQIKKKSGKPKATNDRNKILPARNNENQHFQVNSGLSTSTGNNESPAANELNLDNSQAINTEADTIDTSFLESLPVHIGNNKIAKGKMCYHCTFSFSMKPQNLENLGIKCSKCLREFHIKCVKLLGLAMMPLFLCSKCNLELKPA